MKNDFKPGDRLTLAVIGIDKVSQIPAKAEIFIVVEDESHGEGFNIPNNGGFGGFPPPILNPRPTLPPEESVTTTDTKDKDDKVHMTPEEINQAKYVFLEGDILSSELKPFFLFFSSTVYVMIVVPVLVVMAPIGALLYWKREKVYKARKKCCSFCLRSAADKDGAKVEDANGEFSHEMQIKSTDNAYVESAPDWVSKF